MSLLKKYQLNDTYSLEVCSQFDPDALNGENFNAKEEWVIKEEFGYTTKAGKRFNLIANNQTPVIAIQQLVSYAYTGKEKKLKTMWFKIVKN